MNTNIQTLLGFDFGLKRIGVAVGQTITKQAQALQTITANKGEPHWDDIKQLIRTWNPQAMVVGIPYNMDGSAQNTTGYAQAFAEKLSTQCGLPVFEIDERLSTVAAREEVFNQGGYKALKNKEIDSVAAKHILQGYLASHF